MATVLIVDDSSMARRNLKNILVAEGHNIVAEATNGVQAFVEYEKHKPDLVTMDISMPILNGIDSTKKILLSYPDAKIIMVSAVNQKLMVLAALQNGAKHYIVKPFFPEKVIEAVNEVLDLPYNSSQNNYSPIADQNQSTGNISSCLQQQKDEPVTRPFFIENIEGISVVNISKYMCDKYLSALKLGIQRITLTKPIKVVFNFGDIELIEDATFNGLKEIFHNISALEGSYIMTSSNQNFVTNILDKDNSLPIKLYSEKLEPSKLGL